MRTTILLGLFLSGVALAQEPTVRLTPTPVEIPTRIGPLQLSGEPHKYDQPGMGVSWQYGMPGASLTVYVYDAEQKDLADGADTIPACIEFEVAKQGVAQSYQQVKLVSQHMVKLVPPEEVPLMREAVYEMMREGHPVVSYVWVTTVAGQFLKLRFTLDERLRDEAIDARRAILATFGSAIKPHLAAVDANAKKPGTSIGFNLGSLADDVGAAGIMYAVLLSAVAEKDPDAIPLCGGELVPSFETELGLYRALFVDEGDGQKTKVGRQLKKADEAGFLDELIWTETHRESWGDKPPEGLTLDAYSKWKKKNLRNFRPPSFGSVSFEYPRPLPPEPAP